MSENATIAPIVPMVVDARGAARLCSLSMRTWWSLHSAGKTPLPLHLGRRTLWLAVELASWLKAGAPARDRWESIKKGVRA